jgi:hypothetical protein
MILLENQNQYWKNDKFGTNRKTYIATDRFLEMAITNFYNMPQQLAQLGKPQSEINIAKIQCVDDCETIAVGNGIIYRPNLPEGQVDTKSYFALCEQFEELQKEKVFDSRNKENNDILKKLEMANFRMRLIFQAIKKQSPSELELEI